MSNEFIAFGSIAFLIAAWLEMYDKFKKTHDPLTRHRMKEQAKKILKKKKELKDE